MKKMIIKKEEDRNAMHLVTNNYLTITSSTNKEASICFDLDENRIDELIEWLFKNTAGRFFMYGHTKIYFEKDDDALKFKMRFL